MIEYLIRENLAPIDTDQAFEETIRDCYDETVKVLWLELDAVTIVKDQDPVSWSLAVSEWESNEEMEGTIASFDDGSTYYWTCDIETYLGEQEIEWEESA